MALEIGSLLYNRYKVEEIIAQGGMGAIYRASDESLGIQVAIKENLYPAEDSNRQFRREATLLAGLRHPNLPRVTDHFSLPGQGQYLVMDYIEGEDLRQRMNRTGGISEEEAITIGVAICDALSFLHTRNPVIVHRDIKPGNIKITPTGQVFLVDFGLAKVAQVGQATTTGAQALTPGYASPEQYGQGTTSLSDIYSLGATLYAILTRRIPEDALARAMGSAQLVPLRRANPAVSERAAVVIEKAMAVRPDERYQVAQELKAALLSAAPRHSALPTLKPADPTVFSGSLPATPSKPPAQVYGPPQPVMQQSYGSAYPPQPAPVYQPIQPPSAPVFQAPPVEPPGYPEPAAPPARRSPWPVILAVIVVLGLAAVGIIFAGGGLPGILSPAATATGTPTPTHTTIPPSPTATTIPTNTLPPATATLPPIGVVPSATIVRTPTSAVTFTPAATSLGGGGGQVAFVSLRGGLPQIWLANADGSGQQAVTKIAEGACQPAWSPDGTMLVFVSPCRSRLASFPGSSLFVINANGTGFKPLPSVPGGDYEPDWSPDGKQITFTSLREGTPHIFSMTLSSFTVTRLTSPYSADTHSSWAPDGKSIAFLSTRLGGQQVFIMDANGANQREFSQLSLGDAYSPDWSSDGKFIAYLRNASLPEIYIRQVGVTAAQEFRLSDTIRPVQNPHYSKDSLWIVLESWKDGNHDVYRMTSSGTTLTRITTDAAQDYDAVWRP